MFKTFYTVFYLGPIPIQVWGFFVALGMVLSFIILAKRSKKLGQDTETLLDLGLWLILGGIVGARFAHVFFYEPLYFFANPLEIGKIWRGGLSSFGGLAGAVLVFYIFVRRGKIARERIFKTADLLGFSALFGWLLGRVGCVLIHDHIGRPCNCLLSVQTGDGPRLDMAAVEIAGLIPLAIIFFVFRKKSKPDGWFISLFFIYYGALRFILDFWRATDIPNADARYLGLTPAQYFAIVLVVAGVILIKKRKV